MRNKFEALTEFQSWPEDWQRLCAEYLAESDKPSILAMESIQPRKAIVCKSKTGSSKASRASMPFTKEEYDCAMQKPPFVNDSNYAKRLAKRFGRTKKAFQNYLSLIRQNKIDPNTGMKLPLNEGGKR